MNTLVMGDRPAVACPRGQQCRGTRLPLAPAPSGALCGGPARGGPARGHPCQAQLAPPGALSCPASAQLPSLPCQALPLLLFQTRQNYHGRTARREKRKQEQLRDTTPRLRAKLHVQTAPRVQREPLPHGREQPGEHMGSTWGAPPPAPRRVLAALHPLGASTQLHSSCLTLLYGEFSQHRKRSQVAPVRCSTAPWATEEKSVFHCTSPALHLHEEQDTLHNSR